MFLPTPPLRRSLAFLALLGLLLVIAFYVLMLALAAACIVLPYFMVLSGTGGFQSLILLFFGVAMAASMLWSMVPRRDKFEVPGPLLDAAAHPRLFAELGRIAHLLNEPMPAEVYLIPAVNAFVADRGGVMGIGGRRVMGLGFPLLSVLTIPQLRAVLAHEFAHYYGGDTRLGPFIYKVRGAMVRTAENLETIGELARVPIAGFAYTVVTGILKLYWKIYLASTQMISRRQEYRADELACYLAGSRALIDGLCAINRANSALPSFWNSEVMPLLNAGFRPRIADSFQYFLATPSVANIASQLLEQELRERRSDRYDSHPPLRERINAAGRIRIETEQPGQAVESRLAIALFDDLAAVEIQFLHSLNPNCDVSQLKLISRDEVVPVYLVPLWKDAVRKYSSLLAGITAGSLPEAAKKAPEMAPQIRDPRGMLLSPPQREKRAIELLGMALGLALVRQGWSVHLKPGEYYLYKDAEKLNNYDVPERLASGKLSREQWLEKCRVFGIVDLELGVTPPDKPTTTGNGVAVS